jgi:hypothetical protein
MLSQRERTPNIRLWITARALADICRARRTSSLVQQMAADRRPPALIEVRIHPRKGARILTGAERLNHDAWGRA